MITARVKFTVVGEPEEEILRKEESVNVVLLQKSAVSSIKFTRLSGPEKKLHFNLIIIYYCSIFPGEAWKSLIMGGRCSGLIFPVFPFSNSKDTACDSGFSGSFTSTGNWH